MQTRVAVAGAAGRLGRVICDVIEEHEDFILTERLGRSSSEDAYANADVLIDVTTPEASPAIVEAAIARGQRVIVGTSGWDQDNLRALSGWVESSKEASVIVVPNFSLGSVIGSALAAITAPYFDAVEIIEAHHPKKIDSPSGTAVHTAEAIARARGGEPTDAPFADQEARGQVVAGIPVHSLRLQGVVAKQEVRFGGTGETLTITHDTQSSDAYRGGIRAALDAIRSHEGLTVGLQRILGIDTPAPGTR